ncbi:MAG: hypothetical protein ABFD94_09660 [Armatimonadia bacterium]
MLARLKVTRENGKVTGVTLADLAEVARDYSQDPEIDFTTRLNKPGTMLTIGKITTDGSVKVNKEPNRLTVFPYPRDKEFTVGLDVKALAPQANADPQKLQVHSLAALTQADLGKVETKMVQGRLTFKVGKPGAGRYVVTW